MPLKHLIFLVLFYLGGGVFTSFGFLRQKEVGPSYFRIHGLGLSAILFVSYWLLGRAHLDSDSTLWFSVFLACATCFSLTTGFSNKLSAASFFLGTISFFGTLYLDLNHLSLGGEQSLLAINSILATLVLGFSMAAMMLGHWYLTQPKLSINELQRITFLMILFLGVRFFFSSYQVLQLLKGLNERDLYRYLAKMPGIFVLMRYLWGIAGALVLSFFVWKTVKIRSTQSATGILYVVVVACLVGEILSLYLAFYFGIPA
ncbi:hypothetical protein EBT16_05480 [bacterium]|nr:hypothetical protein [bacterium]